MLATSFLSKCSHKESSFFLHIIYLRRTVFLFVENTYTDIRLCHMHTFRAQCSRAYLNKKSLPRPKTTAAWKLIPHRSKISKNWNPPHWVPVHRFSKNCILLIQNSFTIMSRFKQKVLTQTKDYRSVKAYTP